MLGTYRHWLRDNLKDGEEARDEDTESFIAGLLVEVHADFDAAFAEYMELSLASNRKE